MSGTRHRLLILLVLLLPCDAPAQESPCSRTILVNVLDQAGNLAQVSADTFRAKFRGHPVDILSVTSITTSPRVILLLDASGSMTRAGRWEAEQLLARDIVGRLPTSSFALMAFSEGIQGKVSFAQGFAALVKKLNDLPHEITLIPKAERKTALYDSILAALDELNPPQEGDVIYLITDSVDNKSTNTPSQVEARLLTAGPRVFALVLLDSVALHGQEGRFGPNDLEQLVKHTGGATDSLKVPDFPPYPITARDRAKIVVSARQLNPLMQRVYHIKIAIPAGVDKSRDWSLEVVERGKKAKYSLIYPRLAPCAAPSGR